MPTLAKIEFVRRSTIGTGLAGRQGVVPASLVRVKDQVGGKIVAGEGPRTPRDSHACR